jgi:hypothetical protein
MRKCIVLLGCSCFLLSCQQKSLNEQLTAAFENHLARLDPDASLDSVRIIWNVSVNERLARIIDDTIYVREYHRIRRQLANAEAMNDPDSIAFYHYEIGVLEHGIDSVSESINHGDTTRSHGTLLNCAYFLTKAKRRIRDSTLLYLDSAYALRYTNFMDSSIARAMRASH